MVKAFEIAGYGEETVVEQFGGMYRAFHYGAPPHGGMAAGVDRIVMLLAGEQNLREVALFPMNQRAEDLLMGAPATATLKQLRELHIRTNLPEILALARSGAATRRFSPSAARRSRPPPERRSHGTGRGTTRRPVGLR